MTKSADAFRTISEVADLLDTPAHVLRFWESRFPQIKPVKRAGGRRYYRPADVALLGGIKALLHNDGLTIRGVQKLLKDLGPRHVASMAEGLDIPIDEDDGSESLAEAGSLAETGAETVTTVEARPIEDLPPTQTAPTTVAPLNAGGEDHEATFDSDTFADTPAEGAVDGTVTEPLASDHTEEDVADAAFFQLPEVGIDAQLPEALDAEADALTAPATPQTTAEVIREAVHARLATETSDSDAFAAPSDRQPFESRSFSADPLESDAEAADGAFEAEADTDFDAAFYTAALEDQTPPAAEEMPHEGTPDATFAPQNHSADAEGGAGLAPEITQADLPEEQLPQDADRLAPFPDAPIAASQDDVQDAPHDDQAVDPFEAPMMIDAEEEPMEAEVIAFIAPTRPEPADSAADVAAEIVMETIAELDAERDAALADAPAMDAANEPNVEPEPAAPIAEPVAQLDLFGLDALPAPIEAPQSAAKPRAAKPKTARVFEKTPLAAQASALRLLAPDALSAADQTRAAEALRLAKQLHQRLQTRPAARQTQPPNA